MGKGTYSYIGSSGEMETYPDPYAEVTREMVVAAEQAEREIVKRREQIEQGFLEMAFLLDEFDRSEYYRARGYASLWEWAEDTNVEIGKRVALDLLRIVREAMPVLQETRDLAESVATLADAKISKTRAMLPLLSEGMHDEFLDLIDRAPEMTLRDVNREVRMLRKGDDENGDLMPAVFTAQVKRGEKETRYRVFVIDGQKKQKCGELMIPNEYTSRWAERFSDRYIEYELEP